MLVDLNEIEEVTIPGMNNGAGEMSARMHMDEQGKIIPTTIMQTARLACTRMRQATTSTTSCREPAKRYATEKRGSCARARATSARRAPSAASSTPAMAIWQCSPWSSKGSQTGMGGQGACALSPHFFIASTKPARRMRLAFPLDDPSSVVTSFPLRSVFSIAMERVRRRANHIPQTGIACTSLVMRYGSGVWQTTCPNPTS